MRGMRGIGVKIQGIWVGMRGIWMRNAGKQGIWEIGWECGEKG